MQAYNNIEVTNTKADFSFIPTGTCINVAGQNDEMNGYVPRSFVCITVITNQQLTRSSDWNEL